MTSIIDSDMDLEMERMVDTDSVPVNFKDMLAKKIRT